jgi:hypothetical protein
MSNYFENFQKVLYLFGNEITPVAMQNISKYVNLLDVIGDQISAYIEYEIKDFDRPDTLSYSLYNSSKYDWTFFLMNPRIREQGWPLPLQDVYKKGLTSLYKDWTSKLDISTADSAAEFAKIYPVGQEVILGGKYLYVKSKNVQLGEITFYSKNYSPDSDFSGNTFVQYTEGEYPLTLQSTVREAFGTNYYRTVDSDKVIDLYFPKEGEIPLAVTNLEYLIAENDKLKNIRVIKADLIEQVVGSFRSQIGGK